MNITKPITLRSRKKRKKRSVRQKRKLVKVMCRKVSVNHSPMQISSRRFPSQSRRSAHTRRCSNQTVEILPNPLAPTKLKVLWLIKGKNLIIQPLKMVKKIKLPMAQQMFELESKF